MITPHYRPAWLLVERPSLWRVIVRAFLKIAFGGRNSKGSRQMSQSSLFESVWDQMALAPNLTVATIDANADAVTYRVTFDLVLDREDYRKLCNSAEHRRHKNVSEMKRIIKRGFKFCFSDEENETAVAA